MDDYLLDKTGMYKQEDAQQIHISIEMQQFINQHMDAGTNKLLLKAKQFIGFDVHFAIQQIIARNSLKHKLQQWANNPNIIYPSRISTEQCSSELTATYKQQLIKGKVLCDLTGGLGVDSYFFSLKAEKVIYVERFIEYCKAAQHNFIVLGAHNIEIVNGDSRNIVSKIIADTYYIDPARRSGCNKRVYALSDCEPNILELKDNLLSLGKRVIIKTSPMIDINHSLCSLPETQELHIVAVKNECKELLFVLEKNTLNIDVSELKVNTINIIDKEKSQVYNFDYLKEKDINIPFAQTIDTYLYEPNAAILKSGAFKLLSKDYQVHKLHKHSHLYTSSNLVSDFPGRIFKVKEVTIFSSKYLKLLKNTIPKANITTRNFTLSVAELRRKSGIKEGGEVYLFATTMLNDKKVIIHCEKIQ